MVKPNINEVVKNQGVLLCSATDVSQNRITLTPMILSDRSQEPISSSFHHQILDLVSTC